MINKEMNQPTNSTYKPSTLRRIFSLILGLLILVIGATVAIASFMKASQGYQIVYSEQRPTADSEPLYSLVGNEKVWRVPQNQEATTGLYARGTISIVVTLALVFLIYKYSKIKEIR